MGDLTQYFGGKPFHIPRDEPELPPDQQLARAMRDAGIEPPDTFVFDGKFHRFADGTNSRSRDDSGWYIAFSDGIPAARYGSHRGGTDCTWRANIGRNLTSAEEIELAARMARMREIRAKETAERQSRAANTVAKIWDACKPAAADHPYLKSKGIEPNEARVTGDGRLVLPLYEENGALISLQYVSVTNGGEDNDKRYHPGAATKGGFCVIGSVDGATQLYMAEGYATAATIHQVTGDPVVVAYSASGLVTVTEIIQRRLPHITLTIVADNDESEVGLKHAQQAAAKYGVRYVVPPREDGVKKVDANDFVNKYGGDLIKLLEPRKSRWLIPIQEFCKEPSPVRWLIKGWLQRNALAVVWSQSGVGKTFQAVDWATLISTGGGEWAGHKVRGGIVAYLAGEGHDGLRARFNGWFAHRGSDLQSSRIHITESGTSLDTQEGYTMARDELRAMPDPPDLIVVDTLNRFMAGDENSTKEMTAFVKNCEELKREFSATVMLIHHTGAGDDTQHRMRGSTALKGAIENEISLRLEDGGKIRIRPEKTKDLSGKGKPADVYAKLESVPVPGWLDEDGEQVYTAVVSVCDGPKKKTNQTNESLDASRTFERMWWARGQERDGGGRPYLSSSAMRDWLMGEGIGHMKIKKMMAGDSGNFIHVLLRSGTIVPCDHGYSVCDDMLAFALNSKKNGGE